MLSNVRRKFIQTCLRNLNIKTSFCGHRVEWVTLIKSKLISHLFCCVFFSGTFEPYHEAHLQTRLLQNPLSFKIVQIFFIHSGIRRLPSVRCQCRTITPSLVSEVSMVNICLFQNGIIILMLAYFPRHHVFRHAPPSEFLTRATICGGIFFT